MIAIVPRPQALRADAGTFVVTPETHLVAPAALRGAAVLLQALIRPALGFALPLVEHEPRPGDIVLTVDEALRDEAYRIVVTTSTVTLTAANDTGARWAVQTLRQLFPARVYHPAHSDTLWQLPACQISDEPRFGWRGVMLDVARHFFTPAELRRFIDHLAMHKFNVLHLHLSDDQGWRIQILRYPRLTEVGGWRRSSQVGTDRDADDGTPHGGFYTQDQLRTLVAYAAERGITVVPEIDLPGHSQAAISAYPWLGATSETLEPWTRWGINPQALAMTEQTVAFFCAVLDEVVAIFPSRHIGVGGDECVKTQWHDHAETQATMHRLGLTEDDDLQAWFLHRLGAHLATRGRVLFGWDEILDGGAPEGALVAVWRGQTPAIAAARQGHDVVMCPDTSVYLDYRQSDLPTEPVPVGPVLSLADTYAFEPVPAEMSAQEARHVIGGQANIWTEHLTSVRRLDYMAFPRLCAIAEALWAPLPRDEADFGERLSRHLPRLDAADIEYRPLGGPEPWQQRPAIPGRPISREQREATVRDLTAKIRETLAPPR